MQGRIAVQTSLGSFGDFRLDKTGKIFLERIFEKKNCKLIVYPITGLSRSDFIDLFGIRKRL